jgi:hypothetical protein
MRRERDDTDIPRGVSRRSFLGSLTVLATASAAGSAQMLLGIPNFLESQGQAGKVLYSTEFIPPGAALKLAFVADHHYWPDHKANWGRGTQMTQKTEERMLDLVACLNTEEVDISIHGGDVIDAGSAFNPPPDEYAKQLAFKGRFIENLDHTTIPMAGNHENPTARYTNESEMDAWRDIFGPTYRYLDRKGYRLITLFPMIPNISGKYGGSNIYGLDEGQIRWLAGALQDAAAKNLKVLLFSHVSPLSYINRGEFEALVNSVDCVKAMFCGHEHRNYFFPLGKIPVLMRVGNAMSPLGYTIIHAYSDGRLIVVQKSQHFPFLEFMSSGLRAGAQGREIERYVTIGAPSILPLKGMRLLGQSAIANIRNGHLRLDSGRENQTAYVDEKPISIPKRTRGTLLIETNDIRNACISFSMVAERAARVGAVALADADGQGGFEASLTVGTSGQGQLFLTDLRKGKREQLDRSWHNVHPGGAYKCSLQVSGREVRADWKNMASMKAPIRGGGPGKFGVFVENGTLFLTDLKLEKI